MKLFCIDEIENQVKIGSWEKDALTYFQEKMSDNENLFPCIPATQAFFSNHMRYSFVGDLRTKETMYELVDILQEYATHSKSYGNYSSLIVFFHTPINALTLNVETYEHLFWTLLSDLHKLDQKNWPGEIPINPEESAWEFCFHEERFFMYCATPGHEHRKSRFFPYFMLAITPRWVLEQFHRKPAYASKMRKAIRDRLKQYDDTPPHPELKMYGLNHNYEWKQYFLRDDETSLNKCPFLKMLKAEKKTEH